ncbi:MAG TPA: DUF4136 domain-containing protein [Candidatus Eisenbacteria bacterium]|nr:DUF4136 domain-containing protein [Candidatus Eisenbacteria bacterium]
MSFYRLRTLLSMALLTLAFALTAGMAFAQDVSSNYMPGTDFSKYKTYRWGSIKDAVHPNQIVDAEIKQSVDQQLAAKGFTKVDGESSDLIVAYQTAIGHEREWTGYGMGGGIRFGGMGTATSQTISVGTIVLDFYDPGAKKLVWQGRATKSIDSGASQEKTQKNLDKAMAKLLKKFPPK